MISRNKINQFLTQFVFFFTFLGYYAVLIIMFYTGLGDSSRMFTISIRAMLGVSFIVLLLVNKKYLGINNKIKILYLSFFIICLLRIFIDINSVREYYITYTELLFYFFSFSFLPFLTTSSLELNSGTFHKIFKGFLYSGFVFSIFSILSYSKFIGKVSRLSTDTAGEEVLSPLALSYCSSMVICVLFFYLIYNKTSFYDKLVAISSIVMSFVPFVLGASRGGLLAIILPFIFFVFTTSNLKTKMITTICLFVLVGVIIMLDSYAESGLISRFMETSEAVETGASSAARVLIWKSSLNQFIDNPVLGDKLRVDGWKNYPHNVVLETLQTTGIIGTFFFLILILKGFAVVINVFKHNKSYVWIMVVFIQSFLQNMFSGSLFSASWLWTSLGLLFAVDFYLKRNKHDSCGRRINLNSSNYEKVF